MNPEIHLINVIIAILVAYVTLLIAFLYQIKLRKAAERREAEYKEIAETPNKYTNMSDLRKNLEAAINSASAENGSDTPDFILAQYLTDCLAAYDKAVVAREEWFVRPERIE